MNQQKVQSLIKKIQTILADPMELSQLEKDLVKDYLRQLYDMVNSGDLTEGVPVVKQSAINPIFGNLPKIDDRSEKKVVLDKRPDATLPNQSNLVEDTHKKIADGPENQKVEPQPENLSSQTYLEEYEPTDNEVSTPPILPIPEEEKSWRDAEMATVRLFLNTFQQKL